MATQYVKAERVEQWSKLMLSKINISEDEVNTIAKILTAANLRGVDTHGVIMLRVYMRRFSRIAMRPMSVVNETLNSAVIDGGDRPGMAIADKAMDIAIEKAKKNTVGIVSVRNSNHFGACSYYALKAAEQNMIGIAMTSAGKRLAPWGGLENILGNNPFSVAVPGIEYPIVLDMANSVVAFQKIVQYAREGKELPSGWSLDAKGNPTTDAQAALNGFLMPVGGYKGVGMTIMVDILSGALSLNGLSCDVIDNDDYDRARKIGHFFMAINVADLADLDAYKKIIADFTDRFHNVPKMEGVRQTFLPGEVEVGVIRRRTEEGIPFTDAAIKTLNDLAAEFEVEAFV